MVHVSREQRRPRLLLLDRQPEPRTAPVAETAAPRRAAVLDPEREPLRETAQRPSLDQQPQLAPARHRRVFTTMIAVTAVVAVLLLLAGSAAGAFVFGLVAGSMSLVRYFHAVATQPDRHH